MGRCNDLVARIDSASNNIGYVFSAFQSFLYRQFAVQRYEEKLHLEESEHRRQIIRPYIYPFTRSYIPSLLSLQLICIALEIRL